MIDEARNQGRKVHFAICVINGSLSSQFGVGASISKIQRQSRTPRWHCERWFRIIRSIYWTKIISITNDGCKSGDIISSLTGCAGQGADAVSAYTQVKMEDAPSPLKISKSECPDIWVCLPRHKWPRSWSSMEDPLVPLERNLDGPAFPGLSWERQFEKFLSEHEWEKVPNWECFFVTREKRTVLVFVCGWCKTGWKETEH